MLTAANARSISSQYSQEEADTKIAEKALKDIDMLVSRAAEEGHTSLRWVIGMHPQQYSEGVFGKVMKALKDSGYSVEIDNAGIWNISWSE